MLAIIGRRFWAGSCVQWRTNIYKKTPHHLVPTCMYSNKLDTEHLAVKMSGLVHIFASYRKTKKKSIIVCSVYCHGRMLSDAPFANILFSPRAGVRGVRSDRVHSRLHLHHTWRLDIRWATGLDSSAYSGGMLISVWISEHVYFTVSSGQRSSRYMRESRGHRKYWHCDTATVS